MYQCGEDKFFLYGGENGKLMNQKLNDMWVFIPQLLTWVKLGEPQCQARSGHSAIVWKSKSGNFRALVFGGMGRADYTKDVWSILLPKNYQEDMLQGEQLLESKYVQGEKNDDLELVDLAAKPSQQV